jgi:ATP-dependent protease HslVU (ClpYQ) ATPase subunit
MAPVAYVGRDVERIIRDLVEVAIAQTRERKRKDVQARAQLAAEERLLDALVGANSSAATRDSFRRKLRAGELNDKEIEVETQSSGGLPMFEIPGMPGAQISIGDIFGKLGGRTKTRRLTVEGSRRLAKLAGAPFIKVEATKFTEVGALTLASEALREAPGRSGGRRPHHNDRTALGRP